MSRAIRFCSRGSRLALAQAREAQAAVQAILPDLVCELRVIKTTGDHLQTASLAHSDRSLPKGLFTKELETALLAREADVAVHSLKDLPTDLPDGLTLGAVLPREDARDVLLFPAPIGPPGQSSAGKPRSTPTTGPGSALTHIPHGAT